MDIFNEKCFSKTIREHKELDFLQLVHGSITTAQYEAKCASLSRYACHLITTEADKANKFGNGLRMICSRMSILKLRAYVEIVESATIAEHDHEE